MNSSILLTVIATAVIATSIFYAPLPLWYLTDELTSTGFLDHLLREWPTKQFAAIKRAFFFDKLDEDQELKHEFYKPLANMGASVYRGIYQAIRPTPVSSIYPLNMKHGPLTLSKRVA